MCLHLTYIRHVTTSLRNLTYYRQILPSTWYILTAFNPLNPANWSFSSAAASTYNITLQGEKCITSITAQIPGWLMYFTHTKAVDVPFNFFDTWDMILSWYSGQSIWIWYSAQLILNWYYRYSEPMISLDCFIIKLILKWYCIELIRYRYSEWQFWSNNIAEWSFQNRRPNTWRTFLNKVVIKDNS